MSNFDQKLSVVIPCFNEAKNIQVVLNSLEEIHLEKKVSLEVIVVDGGSTDNSQEELKDRFTGLPSDSFKLILKDKPGGYGNDIMEGVHSSTGDLIGWTHADLQTDPLDIIKAFELYNSKTENGEKVVVKGKRKNRRILEAFFSFGMELVSYFALRVYLSDINAQPKLFSREFYQTHLKEGYPSDFSLDLFALYKAKTSGYKIYDFPVFFKKRLHGEAKGGGGGWKMRIKLIKRTFKYIFVLKHRLN